MSAACAEHDLQAIAFIEQRDEAGDPDRVVMSISCFQRLRPYVTEG